VRTREALTIRDVAWLRRTRTCIVGAALCVLALQGGAAASTVSPCATGDLALSAGAPISPATGEHGLILRLTNHAKRSCTLFGYPGVSFYWRHRLLPFRSVWGGRYGTNGKPRTVRLHPSERASFIVAKSRCDVGVVRTATQVRVYAPNTTKQLRLRLHAGQGVSDISYCRAFHGPNPADPGNTLSVSPVSRASYP